MLLKSPGSTEDMENPITLVAAESEDDRAIRPGFLIVEFDARITNRVL
jgi:hypothetical protein